MFFRKVEKLWKCGALVQITIGEQGYLLLGSQQLTLGKSVSVSL